MNILRAGTLGVLLAISCAASADAPRPTDAQVKQAMIEESISRTPGNCPCPYHAASNGSRCGGRSSYSRPGGNAPLCFPSDITDEMVNSYRSRMR
ncbi:hypothetical protein J2W68_001437 [Luteimonas terrae]|uniref:Uncharacterized protein n=1 Tax=Luteimonas terrae TaxID=1530191 RepID=A0ABU1XVD4_9GAMM|nr:hypothetical protein [Luteimonas terrae]